MNTNAMTLFQRGNISKLFAGDMPATNNLSSGIAASYGFMRYKGKIWTLSYRGVETPLLRPNNEGPVNYIDVVVLAAGVGVSKTFYIEQYVEGADTPPDCSSVNGVVPNPASPHRQAKACAGCPQNQWGSRITPAGKQAKACQDNKRLVIVPLQDILNEAYGGPLLLRVPPTSLGDLAAFGDKMFQQGYPSHSYGTRISFDIEAPHPKFKFEPLRPLNDEEAALVLQVKELPLVNRMLNDSSEVGEDIISGEAHEWAQPQNQTTQSQSSPSTGATSAPPAQPAASTTPTPKQEASPGGSPQGSAFHQPTPTPPPMPMSTTPPPAGFATTANTGRTNGSGFGAPQNQPAPSQPVEASSQATSSQTSTAEEVAEKFEKGLDDMMANLLPKA